MNLEKVEELREVIVERKLQIIRLERMLSEAGLDALDLKIGDRIISTRRSKQTLVEVTDCAARHDTPRPIGVKVKANGKASKVGAGYIDKWVKA